jgi:tagaturonate reductase
MTLPRLSRRVIDVPDFPEKVVQFGTGAFLRGFIESFIDDANRAGRFNGRIVAVSSTGSARDALLNEQDGLFTLVEQGMEGNEPRRRYRVIGSLSRAISARDDWDGVLATARDPNIEMIVSNTTEVGIALDDADVFSESPPRSFPGKLTRFLAERGRAFDYDVARGVVVLPCELIEENGTALRACVNELSQRWALGNAFDRWLSDGVTFCNTLVDRIVPGVVAEVEREEIGQQLGYHDELLTACEPYALFAIEADDVVRTRLGFVGDDPRIVVAPDIRPYRERKVRILNGGHTILVPTALLAGLETVRDAYEDERVGRFLRRVMLDEIVPTLQMPDAEPFARAVLERFANPYVKHALVDITLYSTTKFRVRVVPSIVEYHQHTGRIPASLTFGFAAYLAFMRSGLHDRLTDDDEGARLAAAWDGVDVASDEAVARVATAVAADHSLWGVDLTRLTGFAGAVTEHLIRIMRQGVDAALDVHLTETAIT